MILGRVEYIWVRVGTNGGVLSLLVTGNGVLKDGVVMGILWFE